VFSAIFTVWWIINGWKKGGGLSGVSSEAGDFLSETVVSGANPEGLSQPGRLTRRGLTTTSLRTEATKCLLHIVQVLGTCLHLFSDTAQIATPFRSTYYTLTDCFSSVLCRRQRPAPHVVSCIQCGDVNVGTSADSWRSSCYQAFYEFDIPPVDSSRARSVSPIRSPLSDFFPRIQHFSFLEICSEILYSSV